MACSEAEISLASYVLSSQHAVVRCRLRISRARALNVFFLPRDLLEGKSV